MAVDAVVPGGRDDRHSREPEPLDRLVQGVEHDAVRLRAVQREVRDLDPVRALVLQDPVGGCDNVACHRHAVVVHHIERDDLGSWSRAGVAVRRAGGDACHEGPVPAAVSRRVAAERAEVDLRDDPTAEVGARGVDARIDHGNRGSRGRGSVCPELLHSGDKRPALLVREARERDRCVVGDGIDVAVPRQREHLAAREPGCDTVDGRVLAPDLCLGAVESRNLLGEPAGRPIVAH